MLKLSGHVSNLEKVVNLDVKFCAELSKKWVFGDFGTKLQIQRLPFPSGIIYDKKVTNVELLESILPSCISLIFSKL